MDGDDISRMKRVYRTVLEMLADRRYSVDGLEDMSDERFREKFVAEGRVQRERMVITTFLLGQSADSSRMMVFFNAEEKLGTKQTESLVDTMKEKGVRRGIVVCHGEITKAVFTSASRAGVELEFFRESELITNITKHQLVPTHVVLSPEEKKALLDKYHLKDVQLPRILRDDAVARYYGLKHGDVVKIIRKSETAGRYVTYRIVF